MQVIYQKSPRGGQFQVLTKPFVGLEVTGSEWNRNIKGWQDFPCTVIEVRTARKIIVQADDNANEIYTLTLRCDGCWSTFRTHMNAGYEIYWRVGPRVE
jgi:hypothetical protein